MKATCNFNCAGQYEADVRTGQSWVWWHSSWMAPRTVHLARKHSRLPGEVCYLMTFGNYLWWYLLAGSTWETELKGGTSMSEGLIQCVSGQRECKTIYETEMAFWSQPTLMWGWYAQKSTVSAKNGLKFLLEIAHNNGVCDWSIVHWCKTNESSSMAHWVRVPAVKPGTRLSQDPHGGGENWLLWHSTSAHTFPHNKYI